MTEDKNRLTGKLRLRVDTPFHFRHFLLTLLLCAATAVGLFEFFRILPPRVEAILASSERRDMGPDGGVQLRRRKKPKETWWDVQVDPDSVTDTFCADPDNAQLPACRGMEERVGPNPALSP